MLKAENVTDESSLIIVRSWNYNTAKYVLFGELVVR